MSLLNSGNQITRAAGDEFPLRVLWGEQRLDDVTAVALRVYDDANRTTLMATLAGEIRGFDPATWFPIVGDFSWTGTRHYEIVLTRGAEDEVLPLAEWTQS